MTTERRHAPRKNGFKVGALSFGEPTRTLECLVWDVTDDGALVEVKADEDLPTTLRLTVPGLNVEVACKPVWRDGRRIGVAFVRTRGSKLGWGAPVS